MCDDADGTAKAFWSAEWSRIWGVPCDEWGDPLDPELRENAQEHARAPAVRPGPERGGG